MKELPLLDIQDLHVEAGAQKILHAISMTIRPGEVHVLIGRNGAGKSSLVHLLAGHPTYEARQGRVLFRGEDLCALPIEERVAKGLFMTFQQPVEIPGVPNIHFLKTAFDATQKARGHRPLAPKEWLALLKKEMAAVDLDFSFLSRSLNENFSGGEKRRNELLQLRLLQPRLALLDEVDSGLDAHALALLGKTMQEMRQKKGSVLLITHYPRLLEMVQPAHVHWMEQGTIVQEGNETLAQEVWARKYGQVPTS